MTETSFTIPVVETKRLVLRAHSADDLDHSFALWSHPTTARFIGALTTTRAEAWQRLLRYPGLWAVLGFGYWAVFDKTSGEFIGECGFADFHRDITPSLRGIPELGYAVMPNAHGTGIASEMVSGAQDWIDTAMNCPRCVAIINPENAASIRVAEKSGYTVWQDTEFGGKPVRLFERR